MQLVIVKAFAGTAAGRPSVWTVLKALAYLRQAEVGYVFIAGGVDRANSGGACRVCEAADAVVAACGLDGGGFVATTGNVGEVGRWCPAEAESVTDIGVFDTYTMEPGYGHRRGVGVPQIGPYASFPTITPLSLGEFHLRYAGELADRGHLDLAHTYAERAIEHGAPYGEALRQLARLAHRAGLAREPVRFLRQAVAHSPRDGSLHAETGRRPHSRGAAQACSS